MKLKLAGLFVFICFVWPVFAQGYMILEVNLPDIVSRSQYVFRGICLSREIGTIYPALMPNGVPVTHYKFHIKEVIKGEVGEEVEFNQYGVADREEAARLGAPFAIGITQFEPGVEYVVFLSEKSEIGVRDPVGLAQGIFDVIYTAEGRPTVVNKFANSNLFRGLRMTKSVSKALKAGNIDVESPPVGPIPYEDFKSLVENLE